VLPLVLVLVLEKELIQVSRWFVGAIPCSVSVLFLGSVFPDVVVSGSWPSWLGARPRRA
jgi:hypothetical protein